MLVLTRKQGEKLCIDDDITIVVVRIKGKAARLGIEAPRHVSVRRSEARKRPASLSAVPGAS